jgi:hypothetical protein
MKFVLALAALGEAVTGFVLVVYPPIAFRLLLGAEISGAGIVASRVAGMALIALGVACWPGGAGGRAHCAMLTYSALVMAYLLCLGLGSHWSGKLLWPAVALHAVLTILLAWGWSKARKASVPKAPN